MSGDTVIDAHGVIHRVQGGPEPFTTIPGGLPGVAWCGVPFYDPALGPESCTVPHARPMVCVENPVSCMTCLVRERR